MRCLYCGKEIGALRLLRDREFCSAPHRKNYGERLDKALHQIAAPEPPPAGVSPFRVHFPLQSGTTSLVRIPWMCTLTPNSIRSLDSLALLVDVTEPVEQALTPPPAEQIPPPQLVPLAAPAAAPAEILITPSVMLSPQAPAAVLRFASVLKPLQSEGEVRRKPAACVRPMPVPAAEPAACYVSSTSALAWKAAAHAPLFTAELEPLPVPDGIHLVPEPRGEALPLPAAEAAETFVHAATVLTAKSSVPRLRMMSELESMPVPDRPLLRPAACAHTAAMPAPEPVATLVASSAAFRLQAPAAAPALPSLGLSPSFEALPDADTQLEPPAPCTAFLSGPLPEAACRFLLPSACASVAFPLALAQPQFVLSLDRAHVPQVHAPRQSSSAEAVMSKLPLRAAPETSFAPSGPAMPYLPAIPALAGESGAVAGAVSAPAPEAAETWLLSAEAAPPLTAPAASVRLPDPVAMPRIAGTPVPYLAAAAAAPAPSPLESPLIAASAASIAAPGQLRLLQFGLKGDAARGLAPSKAALLSPAMNAPQAIVPGLSGVLPIPTISVTPPAHAQTPLAAGMPRPGIFPIEFHSHRLRSAPFARPEWQNVRFAPAPPRFTLRPVFEKTEELLPQHKPARKEPDFVETFNMPAAKKPPTVILVAFKIAAGVLLAATLWFGIGTYRGGRRLVARDTVSTESVLPATNREVASDAAPGVAAQAQVQPKGVVAWARRVVADRASLQVTENFRGGMESWGAAAKQVPAGWSRNPDGYVESGALALFHPTLKFTDYRLDFFAQIENKSISWTVRSKDEKNYHAMKVSVVEAGLRPFVALVQYDVVDGKAGRRSQTPLNIMVHNNQPMQVAVDVVGNRLVTSIDGEEIDRYSGGVLAAGGVGFFSDAGEHARLYWIKVSKNDDWLGHVCGFLAGDVDGARVTAGLGIPGMPGAPGGSEAPVGTLAVLGMGLPGGAFRPRGRKKKSGRNETWNT